MFVSSMNLAPLSTLKLLSDIGSDHLPLQLSITIKPICESVQFRKKWKCTEDNLLRFSEKVGPSSLPQPNSEVNQKVLSTKK